MFTLQELARQVGASVVGDPNLEIHNVRPFESARSGHLTLAVKASYLSHLDQTGASAVIVPEEVPATEKSLLIAENPKLAFAKILQIFYPQRPWPQGIEEGAHLGNGCQIHPLASLRSGCWLGDNVMVGQESVVFPGVVVGDDVKIGDECVLYPNVTLYSGVSVGHRVVIHGGSVIGADGFGYVWDENRHFKIPQVGTVRIEDEVEIGANCCVDRATFGETVIRQGAKIDNHVHVGHNCDIGERTIIVGQVGISGSCTVGKDCILAGHSGLADNVRVGDQVKVFAKSMVSRDVESGMSVSGQPARNHKKELQIQALARKLPDIYRLYRNLSRSQKANSGERTEKK